jgi:NAD(P)-dependent dehydrogenase (short-subunit alcohol dehydrogenase family)
LTTTGPTVAVVMVTGARVGIGRSTALAFAEAGMRVVVTSRSTPDVLGPTVAGIEAAGGQGLAGQLDLSDRRSIDTLLDEVTSRWGPVDVLVNNALCDQPGSQDRIDRMDFAAFEAMVVGEVVNTAYLTREVMARAAGQRVTVINVGSGAAEYVPSVPIGKGGFAFSYAADKAALHRLAPFLQLEYGPDRVRAFTVDPGLVRTERLLERMGDVAGAAPPELPATVIKWLALDPEANEHLGGYLHAQELAAHRGWV